MHELGIMINIVESVEKFALENEITQIQKLVLQIGELSSVIPRFAQACYPAAVDGTMLEDSELEIEVLPGNGMCDHCKKVFNLLENNSQCPYCGKQGWELISGREFMIKEIVAY